MMRGAAYLLAGLALAACEATAPAVPQVPPQDTLTAVIDISDQQVVVTRTYVAERKTETYRWPVSTGVTGFDTPTGTFHPFYLSREHKSSLYEDAPMPWSVFFNADVAIHGTFEQRALGRRASHGCVRVHPVYAELFFKQVLEVGKANTTISVVE
jgi:lipoprotein-anchoring transpeptidase ErfK/SrfK